jgi:hypothetical protein
MTKRDINTPEGWTKYAEETNRRTFIITFDRDPIDGNEVTEWVNAMVEKALAGITPEPKPEPQLKMIGGKKYLVTNF